MRSFKALRSVVVAALLAGTASSSAMALDLGVNLGGGNNVDAAANLGGDNGVNATANANVGVNDGVNADVNASVGGVASRPITATVDSGLGTGANVDAALGTTRATPDLSANVNLGRTATDGLGANANIDLGSNAMTLPASTIAGDLNLLGRQGANAKFGDIAALGAGFNADLNALSGTSRGTAGVGGAGGGTSMDDGTRTAIDGGAAGNVAAGSLLPMNSVKLTAEDCVSRAGQQALHVAAQTRYSNSALRSWSDSSAVTIVPVHFCGQARSAISTVISGNENIAAMQSVAAADRKIQASLTRAHSDARHILLGQKKGDQLALYVY